MKPKLFVVGDIILFFIMLVLVSVGPVVAVASHFNADTWGGKVPIGGWIAVASCVIFTLFIFIRIIIIRLKFLSTWKYTTVHGIECFYEIDAKIYTREEVEDQTTKLFDLFDAYYTKQTGATLANIPRYILKGLVCIFKKDYVFVYSKKGFVDRLVYGIAENNVIGVGTGNKPIENTAYKHECGHICINRMSKRFIPETEAHATLKQIGV